MLRLQDVSIVVNGVSRYNGGIHDTVTVKTLLVSDEPIQDEYFVPAGVSPTAGAQMLLNERNLKVMPYKATTLLKGTEDIQTEAQGGDSAATIQDAAQLILLSLLKKTVLTPVSSKPGMNVYELTYEHNIYSVDGPNGSTYQYEVQIPFDGLELNPSGGRIEVTVLLPRQTSLVAAAGVNPNGQEVSKLVTQLANVARTAISFEYNKDPLFTIKYQHAQPVQA